MRLLHRSGGGTLRTMKVLLAFAVLNLSCAALAGDPAVDPLVLPLVNGPTPSVDGRVAAGEYAATFTDVKTGLKVSWQADEQTMHVAIESGGRGWIAMGFGARGMRNTSMVLGFTDKQGRWAVEEQMGKAFYRHAKIETPKLVAGVAGVVEGKTVVEFALPRALSNGQTVTAGEPMPFILACHKSKTKLSKHSARGSAALVLQPK
jgi:hypothetical protein